MNIKIKGTDYELNFGIGFLRELDKVGGVKADGISLGMALTRTLPAFQAFDPLALINVLYSATHADNPRPSMNDIGESIETYTDKQIEKLFSDTLAELKKSPMVRFSMNKMSRAGSK